MTSSSSSSSSDAADAAPPKVNLLDLAASALSSTLVAADQITSLISQPEKKTNARLKHDGSVVTDADLAAQGVIVQALRSVSTHVRLVGEEAEEEMAQHSRRITGHEERAQEMFRLAQQEIWIRYNYNPNQYHQTTTTRTTDNNNDDDHHHLICRWRKPTIRVLGMTMTRKNLRQNQQQQQQQKIRAYRKTFQN